MPTIEFLYDRDCPNITEARDVLRDALEYSRLPLRWREWERSDPAAPAHARQYGSPTILVDGRDVAGELPSEEPSCRIYTTVAGRNRGVPPIETIMNALKTEITARDPGIVKTGTGLFALLPAAGAALLPKLTCPACWPAYAAVLSSLGVGFVDYTPWLFPATVLFLAITLVLLAWRPRRGYWPLALGVAASVVVLIGKFAFDSDITVYAGVGVLAVASGWNAWPRKTVTSCNC